MDKLVDRGLVCQDLAESLQDQSECLENRELRNQRTMPTYEYACTSCGNEWEEEQSIKADPLTECPKCHRSSAKRQISRGAGFILKGGGWYSDLYSSSTDKKAEPAKSTEKSGAPTTTTSGDGGSTTTAPATTTTATPAATGGSGSSSGSSSSSSGDK